MTVGGSLSLAMKTTRNFAGSVVLALPLTMWCAPGGSNQPSPGPRPSPLALDLRADLARQDIGIDEGRTVPVRR